MLYFMQGHMGAWEGIYGEMEGVGRDLISLSPPTSITLLNARNISHPQYSLTAHCVLTGGCREAQWDDGIASFGR